MEANEKSSRWPALLLAIALLYPLWTALNVPLRDAGPTGYSYFARSDFDDYYQAARQLRRGEDPYRVREIIDLFLSPVYLSRNLAPVAVEAKTNELRLRGTYVYPPLLATLVLPLSDLDYSVAAWIFQSVSFVALVAFFISLGLMVSIAIPAAGTAR